MITKPARLAREFLCKLYRFWLSALLESSKPAAVASGAFVGAVVARQMNLGTASPHFAVVLGAAASEFVDQLKRQFASAPPEVKDALFDELFDHECDATASAIIEETLESRRDELVSHNVEAIKSTMASILPSIRRVTSTRMLSNGSIKSAALLHRLSSSLNSVVPTHILYCRTGEIIDKWVLDEFIGAGGFGEVWRCHHIHIPSQIAAIKICVQDGIAKKFQKNEIRILNSLLEHRIEGTVAIRDANPTGNVPYIVSDYVGGGNLADLIEELHGRGLDSDHSPCGRSKPTYQQVNRIILFIARTLSRLHSMAPSIVHRDVKPQNILIERFADGTILPLLCDFGISMTVYDSDFARQSHGSLGSTSLAKLEAGSEFYASRNQTSGGQPHPNDDWHAVAVLWSQCLLGDTSVGAPSDCYWQDSIQRVLPESHFSFLRECLSTEDDDSINFVERFESLQKMPFFGAPVDNKDAFEAGRIRLRYDEVNAAEGLLKEALSISDFHERLVRIERAKSLAQSASLYFMSAMTRLRLGFATFATSGDSMNHFCNAWSDFDTAYHIALHTRYDLDFAELRLAAGTATLIATGDMWGAASHFGAYRQLSTGFHVDWLFPILWHAVVGEILAAVDIWNHKMLYHYSQKTDRLTQLRPTRVFVAPISPSFQQDDEVLWTHEYLTRNSSRGFTVNDATDRFPFDGITLSGGAVSILSAILNRICQPERW